MRSALGVLLLASVPHLTAEAQAPVPLRLIRCGEGSSTSCVEATVRLDPASARLAGKLDSLTELQSWTGALAGSPLIGPGVRQSREISPPVRVLLLIDRSHDMAGEGFVFTRTALKVFLSQLDPGSAHVAIAGFESHAVVAGISAAAFQAPAATRAALDSFASPDARGNRALYSAITAGVARVSAALKAEPGTTGLVIMVTAGPNVVDRRRDEAGLLDGADGLQAATNSIATSGVDLLILALGAGEGITDFRQLVGRHGDVVPLLRDPNQIAAALAGISRGMRPGRTLTYGIDPGSSAGMARAAWLGTAILQAGGRSIITLPLRWQSPLFALPEFEAVAAAGALPPRVREVIVADGPGVGTRGLVALFMTMLITGIWYFVPRLIWIRGADPADGGVAGLAATPSQRAAAAGQGGHGEGLREAPPRSPEEITKQTARRSAERR